MKMNRSHNQTNKKYKIQWREEKETWVIINKQINQGICESLGVR